MFFRSRWKGALTCKSCTARFQISVLETTTGRRLSLRKYKSSSSGTAAAVA